MFLDNVEWGNGEYNLTVSLAEYWGSMATNKSPGKGNPLLPQEWLSFDKDSENTIVFQTVDDGGIQVISKYDQEKCKFWDQLGYSWMNGI